MEPDCKLINNLLPIIAIIISIIALLNSIKANTLSKEANKISKEANLISKTYTSITKDILEVSKSDHSLALKQDSQNSAVAFSRKLGSGSNNQNTGIFCPIEITNIGSVIITIEHVQFEFAALKQGSEPLKKSYPCKITLQGGASTDAFSIILTTEENAYDSNPNIRITYTKVDSGSKQFNYLIPSN